MVSMNSQDEACELRKPPVRDRIRKIAENIKDTFQGKLLTDEPMALHTTMQVGGDAALFAEPTDLQSLVLLLAQCAKAGVPFFVLGGGSNIIVRDEGFCGVMVCMSHFNTIELAANRVICGAGAKTARVVDFFAQNGITGMQSFAGLPGSIGGACYMNARCYSHDIAELLDFVEYFDADELALYTETPCNFVEKRMKMLHNATQDERWSYKHSPFMGERLVVTRVALKARQRDISNASSLKAQGDAFIADRTAKGHFRAPSCGSVFKNNRAFGKPSGALIDEAGLKGAKAGGAQIAPWHANIIINAGGATAADVKSLVDLAHNTVMNKTGFDLECEVIFV